MSEMTSLRGPSLATVFHDYMKGNPAEGREKGESSFQECQNILLGLSPLQSHSHVIFDLDNEPRGSEPLYWPTWVLEFIDDTGKVFQTDKLCNETPEGEFGLIVGKDTPGSIWNRSSGYRLMLNFSGPSRKCSLRISAFGGTMQSTNKLLIPWVAKA